MSMFSALKDKVTDMVRVKMSKSEYVQLFATVCSDESWGPTVPDMDKLVDAYPEGYYDILPEIQLRLDNRKHNWTRAYKSLLILDHFCRTLAPRFIDDLRSFMPTLKEMSTTFFYTDDKGVDRGIAIRERAKKVIALLSDNELLALERAKSDKARAAAVGSDSMHGGVTSGAAGVGGSKYAGFGSQSAYGSASSASVHAAAAAGGHGGGGGAGGHNYGSEDLSPAAMEKRSQLEADLELARRLQEEEDRVARTRHVPTSREVLNDHELAKQLAAGQPQTYGGGGSRHAPQPQQPDIFSQPPTRPQPQNNNSTSNTANRQGTNLDDIFGGAAPAPRANNNANTASNTVFGNTNTIRNNNGDDMFGEFVGGSGGNNNSNSSNSNANNNQGGPQHTGLWGNTSTTTKTGADAFSVLAGMGGNNNSNSANNRTTFGNQQQQQQHQQSGTRSSVDDIFGPPVSAPRSNNQAKPNDGFPF